MRPFPPLPAIHSLISLEKLVEAGWIAGERIAGLPGHAGNVRFEEVEKHKWPLLVEAARNFLSHHDDQQWVRFQRFREENAFWLLDYARYIVLRQRFSLGAWSSWPKQYRTPRPGCAAPAAAGEPGRS